MSISVYSWCVMYAVPPAHSILGRCLVNIWWVRKMNQWAAQSKRQKSFSLERWLKVTQEVTQALVLIARSEQPSWMFSISGPHLEALHCSFLDSARKEEASQLGQSAHLPQLAECLSLPGYSDPERAIFPCCGPSVKTRKWLRTELAGEKWMDCQLGQKTLQIHRYVIDSQVLVIIITMISKRQGSSPTPLHFYITLSPYVGVSLSFKVVF